MKNPSENLPHQSPKAHLEEAASELFKEGKKRVNEVYEEGLNKACEIEENIKAYSDQLVRKIQQNPVTSVLIAGGIGYLLSKIMKK